MFHEFHTLEESLKEYLAAEQSDHYNTRNSNYYKYNNLKIFMDPKKESKPHFIIRIGISEAIYNIENGEKLSGGLGVNERPVRRWIGRNLLRMNLESAWKASNKVQEVKMDNSDGED